MPITEVTKDADRRMMMMVAEFEAPIERVWEMWSNPRLFERWWGPPGYPSTVTEHDLSPGGTVRYHMTGPEGETYPGWWTVLEIDPPNRLMVKDGFADDEGNPDPEMPTMIMTVTLTAMGAKTRMTSESVFPSLEAMQQVLDMGAEEGMKASVGQLEDLLAA